jgi:UDP-2,4-diacetamido-2,4,6-trideoxy-beta-L-altropyranose hydrolase
LAKLAMMGAEIVFRADASNTIGGGHVMRCLALAEVLRARGSSITFVCREHTGHCCDLIESKGFPVERLPTGPTEWQDDARQTLDTIEARGVRPDCIIVDHYGLGSCWERKLRATTRSLAVIDDLADRCHECDLLLDQNYFEDLEQRYRALLPTAARRLLGPRYALLRPEFSQARDSATLPTVGRLFVCVGSHDPFGICDKTVAAIRLIGDRSLSAEIVTGADAELRERLSNTVSDLPGVSVHGFLHDIAGLMTGCSIAVGAGGSSTWERCALGLPSLVAIVADNQRRMSHDLAQAGIIVLLGEAKQVTPATLAAAIVRLLNDRTLCESMRANSRTLVDGEGGRRVADEILRIAHA